MKQEDAKDSAKRPMDVPGRADQMKMKRKRLEKCPTRQWTLESLTLTEKKKSIASQSAAKRSLSSENSEENAHQQFVFSSHRRSKAADKIPYNKRGMSITEAKEQRSLCIQTVTHKDVSRKKECKRNKRSAGFHFLQRLSSVCHNHESRRTENFGRCTSANMENTANIANIELAFYYSNFQVLSNSTKVCELEEKLLNVTNAKEVDGRIERGNNALMLSNKHKFAYLR
uniref:Uncharacterized protein n=1 Tax=Ditylenchus dipsaci TaxID=166011 RepID=A0A915EKD1_9BILA